MNSEGARHCATLIFVNLTDVEQRLVRHVVDGTVLDLAPEAFDWEIDENVMRSWGKRHKVRAEVVRDILRGRLLPDGPDPHGLQLRGAWIVGRIDLAGITTTVPLQLSSCFLPDGLDGRGCVLARLALERSVVAVSSWPGELGALRLVDAGITGALALSDATLTNEAGPALIADNVRVGGDVFLGALVATGDGEAGAVRLPGAHISGQLVMRGARLTNEAGPALFADGIRVGGGAFLDGTFVASGHGALGAVRLINADIARALTMSDATLTNEAGPALNADNVRVRGGAFLAGTFVASGHGADPAVRLLHAEITGSFNMKGATLINGAGPALAADRVSVYGTAYLDGTFAASGHGDKGAVRLLGAHIDGQLAVENASVERARTRAATWVVDGLTYEGFPKAGFEPWLELLKAGTPEYRPQPYRQLAAVARAAGHDDDARRALIAQRDDQVKRGGLKPTAKAWARFTKFTLGYGYQPWRALLGVVLVLFAAVSIVFFTPGALAHTPDGTACSGVETFQIAVDMAIPLVSTSTGTPCHITATPEGQFVAWSGVFLTFSGWALTALFAAGFTRAIRQP